MRVFRIVREMYLSSALDGYGAAESSFARWNSKYTKMVYTSGSRSLAILEMAVHLDLQEDVPDDRYLVEIDIPDTLEVQIVKLEDLPIQWKELPPNSITRQIGDDFIFYEESPALIVPSAIIPEEFNYLINPLHPDCQKIKIKSHKHLVLDPRLFKHS